MRNLVISAILIALVMAAPAMAQNTTWKHVGGAPYAGTDSAAIWTAPNIPSSVKAHLWDQWASGSKKKISVPRGSVLAAVNNRGGWTLRNVQCAWETPQRFPSLPAYEVSWQEGAVLYRLGKFSRDLNARNCGNWYVIISYQHPQPSAQPPTHRVVTPTYVINNNGGIVITGNGNTVTVTHPPTPSLGVRETVTSTGSQGFLLDHLDLYTGLRRVALSNGPDFEVGYLGADLRFWKGLGIFGELGIGRDSQFRSGFPLPVRDEYRAFGARAQWQKGLLRVEGRGLMIFVGDEIRLGNKELDIRAGESYQSAQTLLGAGIKLQYGPVFLEGTIAGFGDYINVYNKPADVTSHFLAIGISAKGIIETARRLF